VPIPIDWHPGLSIYASEPFLRSVGNEYGWLGGMDDTKTLRCILPFTVIRKAVFRLVRFRVETIPMAGGLDAAEEKSFLNAVVDHFRGRRDHTIIPASNNTIFRTCPDGAEAAPYGSYVVDLAQPEQTLWERLHSKHRNVIRNAVKQGVVVREGAQYLEPAHRMITETLKRSSLGFISLASLRSLVQCFGRNVRVIVAEHQGAIQGCAVVPFSTHSAYYVYGGSIPRPLTGAVNLLQWEAMRQLRGEGVLRYDFVGARINPEKGSKQDGLRMFKERFGGELKEGYMWKMSLSPTASRVYSLAVRIMRGGDVVDLERGKIVHPSPISALRQPERHCSTNQ
jgi:hypothetical protein